MGILFIIIQQLIHSVEDAIVRYHGKKNSNSGFFFNAVISFFSMIYFIVSDKDSLCFPPELWGYGITSCLMYAAGFYVMYKALAEGSYVMSKMLSSFSIVFPMFYGLVILKEQPGRFTYIGMALIMLSLVIKSVPDEKSDKKATLK